MLNNSLEYNCETRSPLWLETGCKGDLEDLKRKERNIFR